MAVFDGLSLCFDLDGTLVDTAPDLVRVLNTVIAEDGLCETDYATARDQVGYGSMRMIREAFARAETDLCDHRAGELRTLFLERYADDIARLSEPFPGVIETLRDLKSAGADLSVCTNKPGYLARPLLDALNMTRFFSRIVGSGDGVTSKPAAEHIFAAAGHKDRSRIIMIGDAVPDALAAKAAGVPAIMMAYGYADMPPARLRADVVLRRFRDIPGAVSYLSRR